MSFSAEVKSELCRLGLTQGELARAEAYGVLLYANTFSAREIRIITTHPDVARRLPKLWSRAFGFGFDGLSRPERGGKTVLTVVDREKIREIFRRFGYDPEELLSHHINLGVLEDDRFRAAFLRGAFLAGGSVTDPAKRCHLELVTDHRSVSGEAFSLLLEMGFTPRETLRAGHYMLYFKQSEAIEDFLTTIGAPAASMAVMSAKIEKDMRNAVNRKVNCDSANADKIVSAAQAQLDRIRELGLDGLPPDLRDAALLRIANPEASLAELALLSDPPVSKSTMSYRLKKLMRLPNPDAGEA